MTILHWPAGQQNQEEIRAGPPQAASRQNQVARPHRRPAVRQNCATRRVLQYRMHKFVARPMSESAGKSLPGRGSGLGPSRLRELASKQLPDRFETPCTLAGQGQGEQQRIEERAELET